MLANLEIKRIDLWSLFKIAFMIYAVIGLIVGFVAFFFSLFMGGLTSRMYGDEFPGMGLLSGAFGFFMIPFMAFFYGVIGSVFMTIAGGIFNIICRLAGGLRLEVGAQEFSPEGVYPESPPHGPSVGPPYVSPPSTKGEEDSEL